MKKLFFFLSLAISVYSTGLKAQGYGVQVGTMNPMGETAYILKPGYGGSFHFTGGAIDERWKLYFNLEYYEFKPTQDTLNAYGIEYNYQTTLYPTYTIIQKYGMYSLGAGFTFKILDKKLSPFVGGELTCSYISINQIEHSKFVHSETANDTYWRLSTGPQIGLSYEMFDHLLLTGGIGSSVGIGNYGFQAYWKPFLSINYFIE